MAPELLLGERHGPPVDLWALGCLTFELLTGYLPFTGDSVEEVFEHVLDHLHGDAIRCGHRSYPTAKGCMAEAIGLSVGGG